MVWKVVAVIGLAKQEQKLRKKKSKKKKKEKLINNNHFQCARPNDKLPSVKRAYLFAGQTGNMRAENTFAALTVIGCRDVKQLRSANEIVLFKCEDYF